MASVPFPKSGPKEQNQIVFFWIGHVFFKTIYGDGCPITYKRFPEKNLTFCRIAYLRAGPVNDLLVSIAFIMLGGSKGESIDQRDRRDHREP